jgi:hypothetical protein
MLLLWILTHLALASSPSGEPAPPTRAVAVELPEGVEVRATARELIKGSARPSTVHFEVSGKPAIEGGQLVVEGVLTNTGSREAMLIARVRSCCCPGTSPTDPRPPPGG